MGVLDRIYSDLTEYAKEEGMTTKEEAVDVLIVMTPMQVLYQNQDLPNEVMAWKTLQVLRNSGMEYHNSSELGEFVYNRKEFRVDYNDNVPILVRVSDSNTPTPEGFSGKVA